MRRASDRHALRNSIFGIVVSGTGVVLYLKGFPAWGTVALVFLGGVLVQGESIVGLVRAWRKGTNGDETIRKRRDSGIEDGVEPTD